MKEWKTIIEMLCSLNELRCRTMVLRNFELFSGNRLISMHEDIDILCDDSDEVIEALSAVRSVSVKDKIHLSVHIAGESVLIDLREVGDTYYDEKWERELLDRRVKVEDGYYVPAPIDYIFSLLYHGLFHKKSLKSEYAERILNIARDNGLEMKEEDFADRLNEYMLEHGYKDAGYRSEV